MDLYNGDVYFARGVDRGMVGRVPIESEQALFSRAYEWILITEACIVRALFYNS